MAIEDEIINITDIDVGTEILNNDKLIIETNSGTKLIAFKDLVIGEDNITFKDKLLQGAATGESTTDFSKVGGHSILTSDTTAGHLITYADISGIAELSKYNYDRGSQFEGVSATITQNEQAINHLNSNMAIVKNYFDSGATAVALSLGAVNFVYNSGDTGTTGGQVKFPGAGEVVNPSKSNSSVSVIADPFSITYPTDSSYNASFILFQLNVNYILDGQNQSPLIQIQKISADTGATSTIWSYQSESRSFGDKAWSHIEYIIPGDKISLHSSKFIDKVRFMGMKLN